MENNELTNSVVKNNLTVLVTISREIILLASEYKMIWETDEALVDMIAFQINISFNDVMISECLFLLGGKVC